MRAWIRHGSLVAFMGALVFAQTVLADPLDRSVAVQTLTLELDYEVNSDAEPLNAVVAYVTDDGGASWSWYGDDPDRHSPLTFQAPGEGRFGLFLVLENDAGVSAAPPLAGTLPQLEILVDETPPVVQVHEARQNAGAGTFFVQLRWTAVDANLSPRPIEIAWRRAGSGDWEMVAGPLANTGRYDWTVPEDLSGPVEMRVTVTDLAGHRAISPARFVELRPPRASLAIRDPLGTVETGRPPTASPPSEQRDAARLVEMAVLDRERGELRRAVSRLRQAVELDPSLTEAFVEMGAALHLLGDADHALGAYEIALARQPRSRAALQGSAAALRVQGDYESAAQRLRTILRYNPADAEVWMNLGDVAVFQGDELTARESYRRAMSLDPAATDVIEKASRRLELMSQSAAAD